GFEHLRLRPFSATANSKELTPVNNYGKDQTWQERKILLEKILENHFDFLITEYYPFARGEFQLEVDFILQSLRKNNSNIKVFCSVRDILNEKLLNTEASIQEKLLENYDAVLVHCSEEDERKIALKVNIPLHYTGYISSPRKRKDVKGDGICISCGGGRFLEEFLKQIKDFIHFFQDKGEAVKILPGPWGSYSQVDLNNQVEIIHHSNDLEDVLSSSKLYIGTFGYNTAVALAKYQVNSLIHPFDGFSEQEERLKSFKKYLNLQRLDQSIHFDSLQFSEKPTDIIELDGARKTREIIGTYL
ncbi:MAG: hypothetical protein ACPGJV_06805, partial [Bacteriovoracaceae bacterium]